MNFKEYLESIENRGGSKMMKPDGKPSADGDMKRMWSGSRDQNVTRPGQPQKGPVSLKPSEFSPGDADLPGPIPGGPFGGSGKGRGEHPKPPSPFGMPNYAKVHQVAPSQFVTSTKFFQPTDPLKNKI